MTSFILSLWRWLLSSFRRRTGSNGGFRALWGLLQRLFNSFVCRRANDCSGAYRPTTTQETVPPKVTRDPRNYRNDDGYTIIMASHAPPLLNPTNSNEFGLPAIHEDSVIRSRAPSPSGSYVSAVMQNEPDPSASHTTIINSGIRLIDRTEASDLPDARRRLNTQASRASIHTQASRGSSHGKARKSSVSYNVDTGSPAASMYHLSRQQSRASQNSILSNNSLHSRHSGHSAREASRVASPSPSIREDESAFPDIPVIPPPEGEVEPPSPTSTHPVMPSAQASQDSLVIPPFTAVNATASTFLDSRYSKKPQIISTEWVPINVKPVTLDFQPEGVTHLTGWTSYVHPEGVRYYHHFDYSLYTDANLLDSDYYDRASSFAAELKTLIRRNCPKKDWPLVEGAFSIRPPSETHDWQYEYYLIHLERKTIFWLQDFDASVGGASRICAELYGNSEVWHLGNEMEAQYWTHWELFPSPHKKPLVRSVVHDLELLLVHSGHDLIMSRQSSAPFSLAETQQLLAFVKHLDNEQLIKSPYAINVIARSLATYAHERALNYAGLPIARLSRDQRVFKDLEHVKTALIKCVSPLLFFAPHHHLSVLERLYVDDMINQTPWKNFIEHVKEDWRDLTIMATVLLAVNTAMLAIPSVDNEWTATRSATQILSYISTISSIASILTSLVLIRQYRPMALSTATEAVEHLGRHQKKFIGLETMAIMHSLPYASLMWSMITFLGSFSTLVFWRTHPSARGTYGVALVLVALLTLWCIYDTWDKTQWYSRLLNGSMVRHGLDDATTRWNRFRNLELSPITTPISGSRNSLVGTGRTAEPAQNTAPPHNQSSRWKSWWKLHRSQAMLPQHIPMHNMRVDQGRPSTPTAPPVTPLATTKPASP